MSRKKKSEKVVQAAPQGEVLTRGDAWSTAKAEYLDITRPRPSITALALKYDIDAGALVRTSINQGWVELRSKTEALAAQTISPEDRQKIIRAVDGATLAGINHVVQTGFAVLASEMEALSKIEVVEAKDGSDGKQKGYTRRQKVNEVREILETATAAATALHAIGMTLTPPTDGKGGLNESLKEAINITPLCPDKTVIDNPPPTRLPPKSEPTAQPEPEKPSENVPEQAPAPSKPEQPAQVKVPPPPVRPPA